MSTDKKFLFAAWIVAALLIARLSYNTFVGQIQERNFGAPVEISGDEHMRSIERHEDGKGILVKSNYVRMLRSHSHSPKECSIFIGAVEILLNEQPEYVYESIVTGRGKGEIIYFRLKEK